MAVFDCYLVGGNTLMMECGNILLAKGHQIKGILTGDERVARWAQKNGIERGEPNAEGFKSLEGKSFDYLFSIAHLAVIPADALKVPRIGAVNFHDGPPAPLRRSQHARVGYDQRRKRIRHYLAPDHGRGGTAAMC